MYPQPFLAGGDSLPGMTLQETIRAAVRTTAADLSDKRLVLAGDEVAAAERLMRDLQWPASTAASPRPTVEQRLEYLRDGVAVLRERAGDVALLGYWPTAGSRWSPHWFCGQRTAGRTRT